MILLRERFGDYNSEISILMNTLVPDFLGFVLKLQELDLETCQ